MTDAEQKAREILAPLFNPDPHPLQQDWSDAHSMQSSDLVALLANGIREAEAAAYERAAQVAEEEPLRQGQDIAPAIRQLKDKGE